MLSGNQFCLVSKNGNAFSYNAAQMSYSECFTSMCTENNQQPTQVIMNLSATQFEPLDLFLCTDATLASDPQVRETPTQTFNGLIIIVSHTNTVLSQLMVERKGCNYTVFFVGFFSPWQHIIKVLLFKNVKVPLGARVLSASDGKKQDETQDGSLKKVQKTKLSFCFFANLELITLIAPTEAPQAHKPEPSPLLRGIVDFI